MTEPDIEKKRKRRRSARFYISTAHPLPTPEQIAALADQFPPDADDDGQADAVMRPSARKRDYSQAQRRRLAADGNALPSGAYPIADTEDLHNAAVLARTGHGDVEAARRLIARRAKELGVANPLESASKAIAAAAGNPVQMHGTRSVADRVSPSRVTGQQAPSSGDHGAHVDPMNVPGPRELAWNHPDLRQQSVSFNDVIARLRTVNGDNGNGDRAVTYTAGEVGLNLFNARGAAGAYPGMQPVGHSPQRPDWHQSRGSAVAPNGSHSLSDPRSHAAPQAMKNSELRAEFKRMLFPGSGGGR